jgi:hypothetical protein
MLVAEPQLQVSAFWRMPSSPLRSPRSRDTERLLVAGDGVAPAALLPVDGTQVAEPPPSPWRAPSLSGSPWTPLRGCALGGARPPRLRAPPPAAAAPCSSRLLSGARLSRPSQAGTVARAAWRRTSPVATCGGFGTSERIRTCGIWADVANYTEAGQRRSSRDQTRRSRGDQRNFASHSREENNELGQMESSEQQLRRSSL